MAVAIIQLQAHLEAFCSLGGWNRGGDAKPALLHHRHDKNGTSKQGRGESRRSTPSAATDDGFTEITSPTQVLLPLDNPSGNITGTVRRKQRAKLWGNSNDARVPQLTVTYDQCSMLEEVFVSRDNKSQRNECCSLVRGGEGKKHRLLQIFQKVQCNDG